jgi:sugar lactone lactonase YvrE
MRRTRIIVGAIAVLAMLGAPAQAASSDPYVVYTANREIRGGPVVLRADPATGAVSEVSRNGAQGGYFVHPYDLAVERDGSLLVVDMGPFTVTRGQRIRDGAVIRVDPVTGRQTLVSRGGALVDPAGIAIGPGGSVYVVENVGTASPGVIRINPNTGAQTRVAEGGDLCNPFGLAFEPGGSLVVSDYGDLLDTSGTTVVDCLRSGGSLIRVPTDGGDPAVLSQGPLFGSPFGLTVEPGGRIVVANEKAVTAGLVGVNPASGYQSILTANLAGDVLRFPQRVARTPDGDFLVTDFQLTDGYGGIVRVDGSGGAQRVAWRGRPFDNPLGIAVVVNRPPRATLAVTPDVVPAETSVGFDASGSADPEGRPLRYDWDLNGDGSFEARSDSPTVTRSWKRSAALTVRVRVVDRHGSTAQAAAPLTVDATKPQVARFRASARTLLGRAPRAPAGVLSAATARRPRRRVAFRYELSERSRVAVALAQAKRGRRVDGRCRRGRPKKRSRSCRRWVRRVTLRQLGEAGANKLVFSGRVRGRRLPAGRYRATLTGEDRVGNRSEPSRLRLRVVARMG